jgi:hypothetical protein
MSGMMFALALFGCTDDGSACQRLSASEQAYETRVECLAAQGDALATDPALSDEYPSVFAQCMSRNQLARLGPGPVDLRKVGVTFADAAE